MKPTTIKGKAIVIRDENGKSIDSIDTDMIFHNKYLHITDINEMGQYAFDNLEGWEDFATRDIGEILVIGQNFGSGSSRQQAVDCFVALGVKIILGESFGAIYKRNTINAGVPLIESQGIMDETNPPIDTEDELEINLETGEINNLTKGTIISAKPMSKVQLDIYKAGNLFEYGRQL
ncbi:MAG: 3-isopropylmalate dehydratase [Candidatus Heimdallarchaeota archaeon]|nr:3-isopropylmalate dehydratase [Candidatus Heimdallarchaeota archaeon]MCK5047914.1 3-isopropylmalate dehydratase [Candidatus Heimdallarchaeota archaeon]